MAWGDSGVEYGWLIEDRGEDRIGPSLYWTGNPVFNGDGWSFSHEVAIRFSRKIDAERVIMGVFGLCPDTGSDFAPRVIAVEHAWG